jgi:hypothetical protein
MFCPSCRDEFRDDVQWCPDCEVDLVRELGPEQLPRLLAIERTLDPERLAAIVERLENVGIPYVLHAGTGLKSLDEDDESEPRLEPWEARIYVPGGRADEVTELLSGAAASPDGESPETSELPPETLDPEALKKPFEPR